MNNTCFDFDDGIYFDDDDILDDDGEPFGFDDDEEEEIKHRYDITED